MSKVTGIVTIKVDSVLVRSEEGAELDLGGFERTSRMGHSRYGASEKAVPSKVKFTTAHVGGDDLIGMQKITEGTIEFETDTGDTYLVANATCMKPAVLTGGEGKVAWEFEGDAAEKV